MESLSRLLILGHSFIHSTGTQQLFTVLQTSVLNNAQYEEEANSFRSYNMNAFVAENAATHYQRE